MALVPLIGFVLGTAAAIVDHAAMLLSGTIVRSIAVMLVLTAATKAILPAGLARTVASLHAREPRSKESRIDVGSALVAILLMLAEIACLATITTPAARAQAIVLATMLSRWAIVPIGYGLRPLDSSGLGVPYEGGIRFREFAIASVAALGIAMSLYDVVALAAIVTLALAILALRLLLSRRLGGASGYVLAGGAAICELIVLATLAAVRI